MVLEIQQEPTRASQAPVRSSQSQDPKSRDMEAIEPIEENIEFLCAPRLVRRGELPHGAVS